MTLNDQDRRLLNALQKDARISNQDLAEASAMSTSACWRRVKSLEESAVIQGYRAIIDPEKSGLGFHAIILVQLLRHSSDDQIGFLRDIQNRPEILECFATTGEADYHLRVRCRNLEAYNRFLDTFLFRLPGIAHIRTNLVLKEIKHETALTL